MFDSHAHLNSTRFDSDRDEIINSLPAYGVEGVMNVGCCPASSLDCVEMTKKYPNVWCSVGTHPDDAATFTEEDIDLYRRLLQEEKVCALGEIGLDYYYDNVPRQVQKICFVRQLELAKELDVPVIVHCRDAFGDTLDIIRQVGHHKGVFHCFSGSAEVARQLVKWGWYVGFTGVLTFKNARKAVEAARAVPPDRILVETDCPYMAPEPHRGKRNDSRYIPYMVQKLAQLREITPEDADRITTENAKRLFEIA